MTNKISDILLQQMSELVAAKMGLNFPKARWCDLERGINSAAKEFGYSDTDSCIQWLLSSVLTKAQIEILASYLTTGETYFFREKKTFKALEAKILPELIQCHRGDHRLRIWSAGCATGEEPYSIAILLNKMLPDLKDWNINILATDINPQVLKKAEQGSFNNWSFRDCPQWIKEGYFKKTEGNRFMISEDIKQMVNFGYHNLAEDFYPSLVNSTNAMDIIFCRNVLMYLTPDKVKNALDNFYNCLVDGGWLINSPSDGVNGWCSNFTAINNFDITLFKKERQEGKTADYQVTNVSYFAMPAEMEILPDFAVSSIDKQDLIISPPGKPIQSTLPKEKDLNTADFEKAIYQEALALYRQSRYIEAEIKIMGLLKLKQVDAKTVVLLAQIYANQGRLPESLLLCRKGILLDKLNPFYYYLQATILLELEQIEEAVISLRQALYLDSEFILVHFAMGNICLRQGKLKESRKHYENALALLRKKNQDDVLTETGDITSGRLMEIITSTMYVEKSA